MGILKQSKSFSKAATSQRKPKPLAPLEETREWERSSASQLRMHARCERKWYLRYVGGWPIPFSVATNTGTIVHALLENYFNTGRLELTQDQREELGTETPDQVELAISGLVHYPQRKAPLLVEQEIWVPDGPVPIKGYADLIHMAPGTPTVFDHKTTSNWKYTKSAAELSRDPQAIVYTRWAMKESGADHALFKHVYYLTRKGQKKNRTRVSGTVITQEHNDSEFAKLNKQLERMKELSKTNDPSEAEPNYDACWDYGGCPFRHYCNKAKKGGVMGLFKELKESKTDAEKNAGKKSGGSSTKSKSKAKANTKPKAKAKKKSATEIAHGAVNPPESATVVASAAKPKKKKRKTKKKPEPLTKLTQATIACLPTAAGILKGKSKKITDEQIVTRAVTLAKEVLRQTDE